MRIAKAIGWTLAATYLIFMGAYASPISTYPPPWWWATLHSLAALICINRSMTLMWNEGKGKP